MCETNQCLHHRERGKKSRKKKERKQNGGRRKKKGETETGKQRKEKCHPPTSGAVEQEKLNKPSLTLFSKRMDRRRGGKRTKNIFYNIREESVKISFDLEEGKRINKIQFCSNQTIEKKKQQQETNKTYKKKQTNKETTVVKSE